jgi:manganese oxidase
MKFSRRDLFFGLGAAALGRVLAKVRPAHAATSSNTARAYTPVTTLNGRTLEHTLKNGVKEFHLVAEEIEHEFAPGCKAKCWGYNGSTPGPTIEA